MPKVLRTLLRSRRRRLPGPFSWLQVARRTLQVLVVALLFAIPSLSLYDNLTNQRDDVGIQARWDTRTIDGLVAEMEEPERVTQAVRGSVWTLKVGSLVVSDPLAVVDFAGAARDLWDPFLVTALIPLVLTLLLGRVFCGWICPADLFFELGSTARRWAGIEREVPFSRRLKYAILLLGAAGALWWGTQVFAEIYPPRIVSGELYLWITFGAIGAGAWLMLVVLAFEIFVSRRFWCRYVCPGGALYSLLGWPRLVRLKVKERACTDCDKCQPVCEFDLDPSRGRFGMECNNCGLCVRACAPGALVWRLGLPPRDGRDVIDREQTA